MLIPKEAAVLSFENRPVLAVLMRLASILFMVLFAAVVVADVYGLSPRYWRTAQYPAKAPKKTPSRAAPGPATTW